MKTLHLLIACWLLHIASAAAQITFQKTFGVTTNGGEGNSVQQTTDGGYIIGGAIPNFGAGTLYLIKTNINGDTIWTKTFGLANDDRGYSVQQTADGGFIVVGTSIDVGIFDVCLIKTDPNGDLLWAKTFGGVGDDYGSSVQQTADGGYIITGFTNAFGAGDADVYLIKTDANGDSLWTKTFGGAGDDRGVSVQQTSDGGYIITGWTNSFGAGDYDVYLIRTDGNGSLFWTKTFGETDYDVGRSVQQTIDGGYIITGTTGSFGAGNSDVYLIKTDSNGDSLWTKTFGGTGDDNGYSVRQTTDGGYVIAGYTLSFGAWSVYLIKSDDNGNSLWTKTFGGTSLDYGNAVRQTTDGGYIITGNTSSFGAGNGGIYLIKTDANGNSGCNEGNPATIVTNPATQVTSPTTIVSSTGTILTTPTPIVGSGGTFSTLCTTVGMHEITIDNSFLISPNPSGGDFIVTVANMINKGEVKIYNVVGEKVFSSVINLSDGGSMVNLNAPSGIYYINIKMENNSVTQKLVIQK